MPSLSDITRDLTVYVICAGVNKAWRILDTRKDITLGEFDSAQDAQVARGIAVETEARITDFFRTDREKG